MKRYDLRTIMHNAWKIFRKGGNTFAECLHRAWQAAKTAAANFAAIENAKLQSCVNEECHTWYGWKQKGFEVIHGSTALFQVIVSSPERGDGKTFKQSYFGYSQVARAM